MSAANKIVRNALNRTPKFKVGDRVNDSGTWGKIVEVIGKDSSGDTLYGFSPESGPAKGYAYEILEKKLSKNSIVRNAEFRPGMKVKKVRGNYANEVGVVKSVEGDSVTVDVAGYKLPLYWAKDSIVVANAVPKPENFDEIKRMMIAKFGNKTKVSVSSRGLKVKVPYNPKDNYMEYYYEEEIEQASAIAWKFGYRFKSNYGNDLTFVKNSVQTNSVANAAVVRNALAKNAVCNA